MREIGHHQKNSLQKIRLRKNFRSINKKIPNFEIPDHFVECPLFVRILKGGN